VNPKGNVPTLVLADKTILNEGAATLQWIADQAPESKLAPANGTTARYVLINTLSYLATEVHATFGPLFGPGTDEFKAAQKVKLAGKFKYVAEILGSKPFLTGDDFTVADAYLYVIIGWCGYVGVEAPAEMVAFRAKCDELDFVKEANAIMAAAP
jgi:glutathione S-transferase